MPQISLAAKSAAFNRTRHSNYRASLRLEGFPVSSGSSQQPSDRAELIARYARKTTIQDSDVKSPHQDPYCYPDSYLLINKLNITDATTLEAAEQALTSLAADEIEFCLPPYDLPFMQTLHRQLFAEVYAWAGEIRTGDIAKGNTLFCTVPRIRPEADKFFAALAKRDWLAGLSRDELIESLAEIMGDLNMVHPFREGNGRTLRLWCDHLIINAGFEVDWEPVEPGPWMQASIEASLCEYRSMEAVLDTCIGQRLPY